MNSRAAPSAVHAPLLVGLLRASGPRMCAADDEWRTCRIGRIVCRAQCNSALRCCQSTTAVECRLRPGAGTERVRRRRRDGPWLLPDAPGVCRRVCRNDRLRQLHLRACWSRPVQRLNMQVLHGARDCPSAAPQLLTHTSRAVRPASALRRTPHADATAVSRIRTAPDHCCVRAHRKTRAVWTARTL